jgi:PD-(D/E)XK nuclease superfamily protein
VTIISHSDPWVLEGELLDRVAREKARDPFAPILVVVPTSRLADHVQRRIAVRLGAAIGIDVLTHRALALRILAASGRPARVAGASIEDALLDRVLERAPRGPLRNFVRERPVSRPAFAESLSDLREAGVDPLALPAGELRTIYAHWTEAWRGLPLLDEPGLAVAATPHAAELGRRYAAILHHGAYELTGVNEDLLRALGNGVSLRPATEDGALPDLRGKTVGFTHVQGARAELMRAVAAVLGRIAGGAPPNEQAIVVRSFAPYASAVEALLLEEGIPWHTSFASSLRRRRRVAALLDEVAKDVDRPASRWSVHAEVLAARLGGGDDETAARLHEILDAMRSLEVDLGDTRDVPAAEAAAFLTARVDATTIPPDGSSGGGPRLLDAMQARGLTFEAVGLVGMNAGIWPRVPREDPFLPDEVRRRLRDETGRPVPIRLDNDGEERLLLAMTLGSARRALDVSWRRADDHGRPVVPSLAVRAIARASATTEEHLHPSHPLSRLEDLARTTEVLRPEDELVLVALASEAGKDAAASVRARRPELAAGLAYVAATDAFDPTGLAYDGRVGSPLEVRAISVSSLDTLARCPLQFFFKVQLGIEDDREADSPYETSRAEIGTLVHDVLREVYDRLLGEALFDASLPARVERARELLRQAWSARADDFAAARPKSLPAVDRIESELWFRSLDQFLVEDLAALHSGGERPVELETKRRSTGELPPLTARFDRVVEGPGGRVVGDYKTGRLVEDRIDLSAMLGGQHLQVAVYSLLDGPAVDVLGVGRDPDVRRARFPGFDTECRDGIVETIGTFTGLMETGTYPIHVERHCSWCAYRSACRRGHPPSEFREDHAADTRDVRDTRDKSKTKPTLAAVRAKAGR